MTSNSADSGKEASGDVQASVSVEESVPYRRKEPPKSAVEEKPIDADSRDISPRSILLLLFFIIIFHLLTDPPCEFAPFGLVNLICRFA